MKPALPFLVLGLCLFSPICLSADDSDSNAPEVAPPPSKLIKDSPELRARIHLAYRAAMGHNPALAAQARMLDAQLEAFRKKLHDAIVEEDPSLASVPMEPPRRKAPFAFPDLGNPAVINGRAPVVDAPTTDDQLPAL